MVSEEDMIEIPSIMKSGRAIIERYCTDHDAPGKHTNPHNHKINWDNPRGFPIPGPPINYLNGAPEFKPYRKNFKMNTIIELTLL